MPFGLATSPSSFQRLTDKVLSKFKNDKSEVFIYTDDVLIAAETREGHIEVLWEVLDELRAANLAVKAQKCYILKEKIICLNHMINSEGVLGMARYNPKFVLKFGAQDGYLL